MLIEDRGSRIACLRETHRFGILTTGIIGYPPLCRNKTRRLVEIDTMCRHTANH